MEVDSTSRIVTGGIVWQAFSRDAYMVGRIDDINFHMLEDEILTVAVETG
jgi:hypothetical protein